VTSRRGLGSRSSRWTWPRAPATHRAHGPSGFASRRSEIVGLAWAQPRRAGDRDEAFFVPEGRRSYGSATASCSSAISTRPSMLRACSRGPTTPERPPGTACIEPDIRDVGARAEEVLTGSSSSWARLSRVRNPRLREHGRHGASRRGPLGATPMGGWSDPNRSSGTSIASDASSPASPASRAARGARGRAEPCADFGARSRLWRRSALGARARCVPSVTSVVAVDVSAPMLDRAVQRFAGDPGSKSGAQISMTTSRDWASSTWSSPASPSTMSSTIASARCIATLRTYFAPAGCSPTRDRAVGDAGPACGLPGGHRSYDGRSRGPPGAGGGSARLDARRGMSMSTVCGAGGNGPARGTGTGRVVPSAR